MSAKAPRNGPKEPDKLLRLGLTHSLAVRTIFIEQYCCQSIMRIFMPRLGFHFLKSVRRRLAACLLLLILIAVNLDTPVVWAQQSKAKRNLTVDDFFCLKRVSDPQISPDGEWVAYTVTEAELREDKRETRIWMCFAAQPNRDEAAPAAPPQPFGRQGFAAPGVVVRRQ